MLTVTERTTSQVAVARSWKSHRVYDYAWNSLSWSSIPRSGDLVLRLGSDFNVSTGKCCDLGYSLRLLKSGYRQPPPDRTFDDLGQVKANSQVQQIISTFHLDVELDTYDYVLIYCRTIQTW